MNILLLHPEDFIAENQVRICDARFDYYLENDLLAVGKTLCCGLLNGQMGLALIDTVNRDSASLTINLNQAPPDPLPLCLIMALPRPKMLRRILRNVAMLGIKELHLINSYHVNKSYWKSPVLAPEVLTGYLMEGLSQAVDTMMPAVKLENRFKPFVEDRLSAIVSGKQALLAHPRADTPCPSQVKAPMVLAIGPESGFTAYETEKLIDHGFTAVTLGARIYRVETALPLLVGRLCGG